jgi:hypothetical protein
VTKCGRLHRQPQSQRRGPTADCLDASGQSRVMSTPGLAWRGRVPATRMRGIPSRGAGMTAYAPRLSVFCLRFRFRTDYAPLYSTARASGQTSHEPTVNGFHARWHKKTGWSRGAEGGRAPIPVRQTDVIRTRGSDPALAMPAPFLWSSASLARRRGRGARKRLDFPRCKSRSRKS